MEVFTIQLGKWRLARNRDIAIMDTTVKSGFSILKPSWDIVMGHKRGSVSDEEYKAEYRRILSRSWKENRQKWEDLLRSEEPLALGCYCKSDRYWGCFCHRYILVDLLKTLCQREGIPFHYYGELT